MDAFLVLVGVVGVLLTIFGPIGIVPIAIWALWKFRSP